MNFFQLKLFCIEFKQNTKKKAIFVSTPNNSEMFTKKQRSDSPFLRFLFQINYKQIPMEAYLVPKQNRICCVMGPCAYHMCSFHTCTRTSPDVYKHIYTYSRSHRQRHHALTQTQRASCFSTLEIDRNKEDEACFVLQE